METIFSEDGPLTILPGYEFRPQQRAMAAAIGRALENRKHLVVEAPTGIGKSIAYLVPAILYAKAEGRKAIVSTHTKNLQEQLLRKDVPIVRSLLDEPFRAVAFKGRRNYLCTTRLARALKQQKRLFDSGEYDQLRRIDEWSRTTPEGDLDDLPFAPTGSVWQQVSSEKGACSPTICEPTCFFQQARIRARHADLVIMNHALFFTLFALKESEESLVFENDFVIFDEAHTLEQVAGTGIGKTLSRSQVLFALHRLYNPSTKKGLLARQKMKARKELIAGATEAVGSFFDAVAQVVRNAGGRAQTLRVRTPGLVADSVTDVLRAVQRAVEDCSSIDSMKKEKDELAAANRLLWEAEVLIREFLEQSDPRATYWVELSPGRSGNLMLRTAPSSIAESVGASLFREGTSVIMTSGTLSVAHSLEYFQNRLGAGSAETLILDSPFDFQQQMRLQLVRDIPPPTDSGYEAQLPEELFRAIMQTKGRALVLFTNTRLMNQMADLLRDRIGDEGLTLFVQDGTVNRHHLLEKFRNDISSVLFGLDSFWMGVDVPGEALGHVILTRLPFAVPDHPLMEARMEMIAQRGGNSFMEYTLPEAILKFKQGVGRLIRSRADRGVVTILDSRIVSKRYGSLFLESLPPSGREILLGDGSTVDLTADYS
ncbi:MAG: ATP-dependent DNA helicase [Ignavibacteria bacterium]|nr:ATP-dependent DNA helicase [Ignavibacteria bacterium]